MKILIRTNQSSIIKDVFILLLIKALNLNNDNIKKKKLKIILTRFSIVLNTVAKNIIVCFNRKRLKYTFL